MTPRTTTPHAASATVSLETGGFDVREFARTAQGSFRAELDLAAINAQSLGADALRLLRMLRDLERSTMQRMRNLLVTATHKDARVTAFLTTWAYEKFWIADALDAVLEARRQRPRRGGGRRLDPSHRSPSAPSAAARSRRAIAANFAGPQIVAAHVTTGLVDEWITQAAYRRLGELADGLHAVVGRIVTIKDRHIRFLAEEAQRRLAASPAREQADPHRDQALGLADRRRRSHGRRPHVLRGDRLRHPGGRRRGRPHPRPRRRPPRASRRSPRPFLRDLCRDPEASLDRPR